MAPDQNLSCLSVVGEGMFACECHSLDTEQKISVFLITVVEAIEENRAVSYPSLPVTIKQSKHGAAHERFKLSVLAVE